MTSATTTTETAKYVIKCDDCKVTIGTTDSLRESAEGGQCAKCEAK